jgi:hypothetical protein
MAISAVDFKNAMLATPTSYEGRRLMGQSRCFKNASIMDYLDACYVQPTFIADSGNFEENDLNEMEDFDLYASEALNREAYFKASRIRRDSYARDTLERNLLGFDKTDLKNRTFSTVYMIEGPAGCGKTTYGYKLLHDGGFDFDYLNIENATRSSFKVFGKPFDLSKERHPVVNPVMALQGLFINLINKILAKTARTSNSDSGHMDYIRSISNVYDRYFDSDVIDVLDTPNYREFFRVIKEYANNGDYSDLSQKMHNYYRDLINECNRDESESYERGSFYTSIRSLVGIIMRLYYCTVKMSSHNEKRIMFLDNFERFMISKEGRPYATIYDIHLQMILTSLYEEADKFADLIFGVFDAFEENEIEEEYVTTFGIVIALREATLNQMRGNHIFARHYERHRAESSPTYVNLTRAFNYKEIIDNKVNYFLFGKSKHEDCDDIGDIEFADDYLIAKEAFNNILADKSASKWSLRHLVLDIFNENYRKFALNLLEAVITRKENFIVYNSLCKKLRCLIDKKSDTQKQAQELLMTVEGLENEINLLSMSLDEDINSKKKTLLLEAKETERLTSEEEKKIQDRIHFVRHLGRKLVLRSLLDFIDNASGNNSFFKSLFAIHEVDFDKKDFVKATYFYRIITYLHNISISGKDNVSNFPSLIACLLKRPSVRVEDMTDIPFEDIARVLEVSTETAKIKTNGDELIFMNVNPLFNKDLCEIMEDL